MKTTFNNLDDYKQAFQEWHFIQLIIKDKEKGIFEFMDIGIDFACEEEKGKIEEFITKELLKDFEIIENDSKVVPSVCGNWFVYLSRFIVKR